MLYFIVGPGKGQTKVIHGSMTEAKFSEDPSKDRSTAEHSLAALSESVY